MNIIKGNSNVGLKNSVAFHTFGCKLNFSESSTIQRQFEGKNYQIITNDKERYGADISIINTCSVTENADNKCRKLVRDIRRQNFASIICIIGCFAQLKADEIKSISGVDIVIGAADKFNTVDIITSYLSKEGSTTTNGAVAKTYSSGVETCLQFIPSHSISERTRAFVKVQDGCDYKCSFCTIPLARGRSRSDGIDAVVGRIEDLRKYDVKEVVLTGINLGDYGIVNSKRMHSFLELLERLVKIEHIRRYRISSIEPNLLSDEILQLVSSLDKIAPHFHIPLQSGSSYVLKKMRRRYDVDYYRGRVESIKKYLPDACIGVDLIVGFPGETDEHFSDTLGFISDIDISYLHVFPYSERESTVSKHFKSPVPMSIRNERAKVLRALSDEKRLSFYSSHLGEMREVLFEKGVKGEYITGFTDNYIKVYCSYDSSLINKLKMIELMKVGRFGFVEVV